MIAYEAPYDFTKYLEKKNVKPSDPTNMSESDRLEEAMKEGKEGRHFAHMAIPTQKDIERALLERKKRELLNVYALDD